MSMIRIGDNLRFKTAEWSKIFGNMDETQGLEKLWKTLMGINGYNKQVGVFTTVEM